MLALHYGERINLRYLSRNTSLRQEMVAQMYWDLLRPVKIGPSQLAPDRLLQPPLPDVGHRSNRSNDTKSWSLH